MAVYEYSLCSDSVSRQRQWYSIESAENEEKQKDGIERIGEKIDNNGTEEEIGRKSYL